MTARLRPERRDTVMLMWIEVSPEGTPFSSFYTIPQSQIIGGQPRYRHYNMPWAVDKSAGASGADPSMLFYAVKQYLRKADGELDHLSRYTPQIQPASVLLTV